MDCLQVDLSEPETRRKMSGQQHERGVGCMNVHQARLKSKGLYPKPCPILRNLLAIRSEGRNRLPVTLVRLENRV
jgi:hypothetical protein